MIDVSEKRSFSPALGDVPSIGESLELYLISQSVYVHNIWVRWQGRCSPRYEPIPVWLLFLCGCCGWCYAKPGLTLASNVSGGSLDYGSARLDSSFPLNFWN